MSDRYLDGLTPEIVAADKETATRIAGLVCEFKEAVHALALAAFKVDPDLGLHYLNLHDQIKIRNHRHTTTGHWTGGPTTGPHATVDTYRRTTGGSHA